MSKKGLACGIVGLPNVGKSTFFKALTRKAAAVANYPFCTIDPNVGIIDVDDPRLRALSNLSKSATIIPATVTFVDIAGLVKGASQGEGLGNQFLANIRETDVILQVVRSFKEPDVIHVSGKVDPIDDIEVINLELVLSDLQMAENISHKLEKQRKTKKELEPVYTLIQKVIKHLNQNNPLRTMVLTAEEESLLSAYPFLTHKKILYVINISEPPLSPSEIDLIQTVCDYAKKEGSFAIPICAKIEEELSQFTPEEAKEYLSSLGLHDTALHRLVQAAFRALGLITFLTTGEMETRAWPIRKGSCAQEAAGEIHSDIQKKFIRAEVVTYDNMITYKGRAGAREAGKARSEGKEYLVQDGDVILFYHS